MVQWLQQTRDLAAQAGQLVAHLVTHRGSPRSARRLKASCSKRPLLGAHAAGTGAHHRERHARACPRRQSGARGRAHPHGFRVLRGQSAEGG